MSPQKSDYEKRRLTDRAQLVAAVKYLESRGVLPENMALQLTRHYYVDIDALNEVLAALSKAVAVDQKQFQKVA